MKVLLVVDDMIIDMESNKIVSPIVTELLLREKKKLNVSIIFISLSYFKMPKTVSLNASHYFIIKNPHKEGELQQIP